MCPVAKTLPNVLTGGHRSGWVRVRARVYGKTRRKYHRNAFVVSDLRKRHVQTLPWKLNHVYRSCHGSPWKPTRSLLLRYLLVDRHFRGSRPLFHRRSETVTCTGIVATSSMEMGATHMEKAILRSHESELCKRVIFVLTRTRWAIIQNGFRRPNMPRVKSSLVGDCTT